MLVGGLAMAVETDTDTDSDTDSDTDTDVDTDTDADTDSEPTTDVGTEDTFCYQCIPLSEVAEEEGGNPCSDGSGSCDSSGGMLPMLALVGTAALVTRRRER